MTTAKSIEVTSPKGTLASVMREALAADLESALRAGEQGSRLRAAVSIACSGRTRGWIRRAFGPQLSREPG